jgi:hypothetical protein
LNLSGGRAGFAAAAIVAAAILALASAGTAEAADLASGPPVDRQSALVLIRSALAALDQADKTGNYTVLRDLGGPQFRKNTDARLAEVFAGLRSQSIDLSPVLAVDPVFTLPPTVAPSGLLHTAGAVMAGAKQLHFEIAWQKEDGVWKLYGIVVTASEPAPPAGIRSAP